MSVEGCALRQASLARCPSASVYHTLDWQRVIQSTYGYRLHCVVTRDDGQVTGLLPLYEVNSLISGRHLTAIPFSHHVVALYESARELERMVHRAQQIARQRNCGYIEVRGSAQALASMGFRISAHNWISQLDLRVDKEALWCNVRESTRRNVKKARKSNLSVRLGTGAADFDILYRLMLETRRYQGSPPYPKRLFAALQTMPQARLYLVCCDQDAIAGMVVLCHNKRVIYAYGASTKSQEVLRLRPNDLLFWYTIAQVQADGYETFDFGTTPIGNENLLRFKENWGARSERLAYAYWLNKARSTPVPSRDSRTLRLVSACIRRMPLWALRLVGELWFGQLG